jgi:hypothetical protein
LLLAIQPLILSCLPCISLAENAGLGGFPMFR